MGDAIPGLHAANSVVKWASRPAKMRACTAGILVPPGDCDDWLTENALRRLTASPATRLQSIRSAGLRKREMRQTSDFIRLAASGVVLLASIDTKDRGYNCLGQRNLPRRRCSTACRMDGWCASPEDDDTGSYDFVHDSGWVASNPRLRFTKSDRPRGKRVCCSE